MIKQFILIVGASVAAIFLKDYLMHGITFLVMAHNEVSKWLVMVFANDQAGLIIQGVVSLILIPLVVAGILNFAYWAVKKTAMPHTLTVVWVIWTIILTTLLAQTQLG